jgi:hypothetical protein
MSINHLLLLAQFLLEYRATLAEVAMFEQLLLIVAFLLFYSFVVATA